MQFWGVQKTKTKKTLQLGSNRHHHHLSTGLLSSKKLIGTASCASSPFAPARGAGPATLGLAAVNCFGRKRKRRSTTASVKLQRFEAKALFGWWVSLGWRDDKKDPRKPFPAHPRKISKCATWWLNEQQDLEGKSGTHQRRLGKSHANPAPQCTICQCAACMISRKLLSQVNIYIRNASTSTCRTRCWTIQFMHSKLGIENCL